jgi:hypothetical protein
LDAGPFCAWEFSVFCWFDCHRGGFVQSSKLTGLLLSVEILGDQSGTQNQHQQRNDESPLICGEIVGSCRLNEPAQAAPP